MMESENQTPNLTLAVGEKTSKSGKKAEKTTAETEDGENLADFEVHEVEPTLEHQIEKQKNKKRKGEDKELSRSAKKLKKSKASIPQ